MFLSFSKVKVANWTEIIPSDVFDKEWYEREEVSVAMYNLEPRWLFVVSTSNLSQQNDVIL